MTVVKMLKIHTKKLKLPHKKPPQCECGGRH